MSHGFEHGMRLLADWAEPCNISPDWGEGATMFERRGFLSGTAAFAALMTLPPARIMAAAAEALKPVALPPPISTAERLQRIAGARRLMQQNDIGAVVVESGSSLDYLTGVEWHRSERLTAAVIPVQGDPIVVTPFFERPSVAETLAIPAEIRTWNEDEDPLKLVADFLKERGVASDPIGFEETDRYFIVDRLGQQLPGLKSVSANPVVRALRLLKSPAELALMQTANDITLRAMRHASETSRPGMTPDNFAQAINAATTALGGNPEFALVLIDEASALPHGSRKPQRVRRGSTILFDCGCTVHGYQSDISRTYVWGADPTPEQRKVWNQVHEGQQIAIRAAKIGVPAGSVDDAVRAAYERWGYGPGYKLPGLSHRTGHGIGMDGHEPAYLVHGDMTPLAAGMCFSDEPGIYIPGKFGIRLEDCWHMTENGPKFFSNPPPSIDRPFG